MEELPPLTTARFTPPPAPKVMPPMVVRASSVLAMPTHQIRLIRGEASTLPDLPLPEASKSWPEQPGFSSDAQPQYPVLIGADVCDHRLIHVTWTNPETKESFEAWCGWDFTLLASIAHIEINEKFSAFHLSASHIDMAAARRDGSDKGEIPVHPPVLADDFVISKGDAKNAEAQVLLKTLRDYYLRNRPRLILIKQAQDEYQTAAAAWHEAHPPKRENHTFWLKPHRGSRYLTQEGGR